MANRLKVPAASFLVHMYSNTQDKNGKQNVKATITGLESCTLAYCSSHSTKSSLGSRHFDQWELDLASSPVLFFDTHQQGGGKQSLFFI